MFYKHSHVYPSIVNDNRLWSIPLDYCYWVFPVCFTPGPVAVPFRNIFSKPPCKNDLQSNVSSLIRDTTQGIFHSSFIHRAAEGNLKGLTLFVFAKSALSVTQLCLHLSPFFLCSGSYTVALRFGAFLPACWGSFCWQHFLLLVGCSYSSPDLLSSQSDLYFIFTSFFANILMFFYLLEKINPKAFLLCL